MPPNTAQRREFVHPEAGHAKKKYGFAPCSELDQFECRDSGANKAVHRAKSPYGIEPISVFYIFLAANAFAALFAPIQDCDETFNYWEPTHYLSHGYGLQTWEYSPDFAIRSWLYVGLHAVVANIRRLLPRSTKVQNIGPWARSF